MTTKQALIAKLNVLRAEVGEAPSSEKWNARAKTWTVKALIEIYEKEAALRAAAN